MNILKILEEDHKIFIGCLKKIESCRESKNVKDAETLLRQFYQKISIHNSNEEELLYPEILESLEDKMLIRKSYEAHNLAANLVKELLELPKVDENWFAKLLIIKENIMSHIEEEENLTFPIVRESFPEKFLLEMGKAVQEKRKYQQRE